jgi:hypothetical protein
VQGRKIPCDLGLEVISYLAIFVFVIDHDACLLRCGAHTMPGRHQPKVLLVYAVHATGPCCSVAHKTIGGRAWRSGITKHPSLL